MVRLWHADSRRHGYAVPVVLMSAVDVEVDLPGVRFLPKPFDRDHLLHVIGSALERTLAPMRRIALFPDPLGHNDVAIALFDRAPQLYGPFILSRGRRFLRWASRSSALPLPSATRRSLGPTS